MAGLKERNLDHCRCAGSERVLPPGRGYSEVGGGEIEG